MSRKSREIAIELSALIRKEENQYTSWCPELDVSSCGDNIEEARDNLFDAVDLYLRTLAEESELAQIFQERNIKPIEKTEFSSPLFLSCWKTEVTVRA